MQVLGISKKLTGALAALALCTTSTGAIAASTPSANQRTISPLVALSAFGTAESRAAVCAAGSAAAAAGAAVAAQGAAPGCVLPVVDAPLPPPVAQVVPPPYVEPVATGGGLGIIPLLLGLAALAAVALLLLKEDDDDDEIVLPISPN